MSAIDTARFQQGWYEVLSLIAARVALDRLSRHFASLDSDND